MNLEEYKAKQTFRFCLFGKAKVGKSALAAELARVWKLWWFDLEDGVKTALHTLPKEFHKNIEVFRIPSHQNIPMAAETLLKVTTGKAGTVCWTHGKWNCQFCTKEQKPVTPICLQNFTTKDCLVIDSTTQLTSDVNAAVLYKVLGNKEDPGDFILDKDTGGKDFKYPMAVSTILDRIFGTLQASNLNVVVISHEVMTESIKDTGHVAGKGENQPNTGGETIFPACGSRNFSRNYGRYFDALIHLTVRNGKHRAFSSTTYDPLIQTGSRLARNLEDFKDSTGQVLRPGDALIKLVNGGT